MIERHADRVTLVHLTATIPGSNDTVQIGLCEGRADLQACVAPSLEADVDWLIYENGRTYDPKTAIIAAVEEMQALLES